MTVPDAMHERDGVQTKRHRKSVPSWLASVFETEESARLKLAIKARFVAVAVIALWLVLENAPAVIYYEVFLALFLAIGGVSYALGRGRRVWLRYVCIALDFALLTYMVIAPNPFSAETLPPQDVLRIGSFLFYFVLVAVVALSLSPALMLWAALTASLSWSAGVWWVIAQPDTLLEFDQPPGATRAEALAFRLQPHFVDVEVWIQEIIVVLLVAGILSGVVWRMRRLVIRQAETARERINLARYFPPTIVDQLAHLDEPLGVERAQPVAVLFADIVGFTTLAEQEQPKRLIALLREFHTRIEHEVFDHQGTLDKFLGDGVMVTFGTPSVGPRDAANAVACARAILASVEQWNLKRAAEGEIEIRVSMAVHYGEVVLGDIGSERRMEFAVLGDVVNVASRLEALTRDLGCRLVVSDDLVRTVRNEVGALADPLLVGLRKGESQPLRGRGEPIAIWLLPLKAK